MSSTPTYDDVCQPRRQHLRLLLVKAVLVFGQEVIDLARGDVDAEFVQLFQQQRLGDVAVVILVEDVADQVGAEVAAGQDVGGQRGQQGLAVGGQDAFAQVAGDLGLEDQFLDEVFLVAMEVEPGRRVGEGNLTSTGVRKEVLERLAEPGRFSPGAGGGLGGGASRRLGAIFGRGFWPLRMAISSRSCRPPPIAGCAAAGRR